MTSSTVTAVEHFRAAVADLVMATHATPPALTRDNIVDALEEPRDAKNGDIALPLPSLKRFAKFDGNPAELAKAIHSKLAFNDEIVAAQAIGPFLNFRVNKSLFVKRVVSDVLRQGDSYGYNDEGKGRATIVEFSSPNIAKPFHAGHLRSTIIGNFLANLHEALGFKVTRINYLGDWGKQYGLLAVGFERYGSEVELLADPIKHLFDVYVKINRVAEAEPTVHDVAREYFKRMEDGDEQALALWRRFRDLSISKYKDIYARLNVRFDVYSGESLYGEQMKAELQAMLDRNLLLEENGALLFDMTKEGMGKAVIRKSNGTTLYITRDVAAAHDRYKTYTFERMIYVVALQQELHFRQLFHMLKKMGYEWTDACKHVPFGMVQGMSTRRGEVVFLEDILNGAREKMQEVMKKTPEKYAQLEDPDRVADIVALSAVVIQDMGARRIKDYVYSEDRMTSSEGDTGPYLQYTHARVMSIERKFGSFNDNADLSLLTEPSAVAMAEALAKYPNVVQVAFKDLEPNTVVNYAFALSHAVSTAIDDLRVVGQEQALAEARLALYRAARITLGNCLRLVGLTPLERM